MVHSPKTFLKNLLEMIINLTIPNGLPGGVCGKTSLLACYIGKIQSEIIIQIKTLLRATFKYFNCESWRRFLTKEKQDSLV